MNGISVRVDGTDFWWALNFSATNGMPLAPGHHPAARRYPFTSFNGLDLHGNGRGCNTLTGRYLVREVEYGLSGSVLRLAVDVEQHCEDAEPALFAALRYNSMVPTDIFPGSTDRYSLTVSPAPGGLVSSPGLAFGDGLSARALTFGAASVETLTAMPLSGYLFTGWTGD